jgi:hypothetical protein
MPPGGAGKADGYTTIKGSDIPSAYVDPNKSYMIQRNIANLNTVGALDAVEAPLAKRIDGIIANMPADGLLNLAELVRMENPTINASLFPQEKAALPKLWKLVEAPDSQDAVFGPKDNFGSLDQSLQPAAAVMPATLAISSLSAELQDPATRLQNLYNSDGNTATVSYADLTSGIANPSPFTQAEVTAFGTIQAVFRTQAVAQGDARFVLSPGPGAFTQDATLGPATFHMTGTVKLDETRQAYYSTMTASLTATETLASTVVLPASAQVLVLAQDSGAETVFGSGNVPNSVPSGDFVFEVWSGGSRMFVTNANLPVLNSTATIPLNDKLDYTVMSGLTPLVRNLNSATFTYTGGYYTSNVHYTYDKMTIPPPTTIQQQAVTYTASPTVTIPVGRYSIAGTQGKLYVYPNNVLWFSYGTTPYRLTVQANPNAVPTRFANTTGLNASFDASQNVLQCTQCQPVISVKLDASMRDI